ncbi:hypothetical protein [Anaeromicropila herbilytica]|uniref:Uncharacterized protein n=1 Tax=Anaeromicropila herbilytica TaxID=2785025 RepID=A0A7R7EPW3_9FIRM|nr:hypothetical protein [Anaeromicropila herbilytica]BCN32312.1 hypothetical protein bsdtb5_36070 [Anaeromicropila herbilytica]
MDYDFYWQQFEKTGNISDYLNYTACTSEDEFVYQSNNPKDKKIVHGEEESIVSSFS